VRKIVVMLALSGCREPTISDEQLGEFAREACACRDEACATHLSARMKTAFGNDLEIRASYLRYKLETVSLHGVNLVNDIKDCLTRAAYCHGDPTCWRSLTPIRESSYQRAATAPDQITPLRPVDPGSVAPVAADATAAIDAAGSVSRPTVLVADAGIVAGGLDEATVVATMKSRASAFTECYRQALVVDPEIGGLARFTCVISHAGIVKDVEIGRIDVRMEGCVVGALEATRFPVSANGDTDVSLPVSFKRVP
jgi:hypothetical protein